jgi:hypothetical protein
MILKKSSLSPPLAVGAWLLAAMAGPALAAADKVGVVNLSGRPIMIHNHWVPDVSTPGGILLTFMKDDGPSPKEPKLLAASRRWRECGVQSLEPMEMVTLGLPEAASAADAKTSVTVLRIRELGDPDAHPVSGFAKLTITREGKALQAVIDPFVPDAKKEDPSAQCLHKEDSGPDRPQVLFFLGSETKAEGTTSSAAGEPALPPEAVVHIRFQVPEEPGQEQSATVSWESPEPIVQYQSPQRECSGPSISAVVALGKPLAPLAIFPKA